MVNLSHSASFHSREKTAPSNPGIKQLQEELERVGWTGCYYEGTSRKRLPQATLSIDAHTLAAARRKFDLAADRARGRLNSPEPLVRRSAIVHVADVSIVSDVVEEVELGDRLQRLMHRVME